MDNFINLAKQGFQAYEASQHAHSGGGDGDHAQDRRHHEAQAIPHLDHDEVVKTAHSHSEGSGDHGLFSSAMSHIKNNNEEHTSPVDEEHVTRSHKQAYEEKGGKNLDAGSMGAAAAMEAFKMFTSGKSGSGGGHSGGGSSQLISLAMGEASKLFDSSGGSSSGKKQDVVNNAAMTMMKLVVQSKMGHGHTIGGSHSGGLSSLMGLAQKLL